MTTKIIEGFESFYTFNTVGSVANLRNDYDIHLQGNKSVAFDKVAGSVNDGISKVYPAIDTLIYDGFEANWYVTAVAKNDILSLRTIFDDNALPLAQLFPPNLYEYECNVEPPAWVTNPWTLVPPSVDYATAMGALRIKNPIANNDRCFYNISGPALGWNYAPPGAPYKFGVATFCVNIDAGSPPWQCIFQTEYRGATVVAWVEDGFISFLSSSGLTHPCNTTTAFAYVKLIIAPEAQTFWVYVNGKYAGSASCIPSGSNYSLTFGANPYGTHISTAAQIWAYIRWGHLHENARFAEFDIGQEDIVADSWNQQAIDQRSPTLSFNGFNPSNVQRVTFLTEARITYSAFTGVYLDNFLALTSNYVYEQPVFLAEWTMNSRVVESFDGVSVDDFGQGKWFATVSGGPGVLTYAIGHKTINGLQLSHSGITAYIRGTLDAPMSFAPYGSDNNNSIQADFKVLEDAKIPRILKMFMILYTDVSNYFTYEVPVSSVPVTTGWNSLVIAIKSPTSVTGSPSLSNITLVAIGQTLDANYPDYITTIYSDLRWTDKLWARNSSAPRIEYNTKTGEFASIKFDKTSAIENFAGVYATYLSPLNLLAEDEYSIDFSIPGNESQLVDHFEVVLDESKHYIYNPDAFLVAWNYRCMFNFTPLAYGFTAFGDTSSMTTALGVFSCSLNVAAAGGYEWDYSTYWTDSDELWFLIDVRVHGVGTPSQKALFEVYCKNTYYPFYLNKDSITHYDEASTLISTAVDLATNSRPIMIHIFDRGEYEIFNNNNLIYRGVQKPANISTGNKIRFGRTASPVDVASMDINTLSAQKISVNGTYGIFTDKPYSYFATLDYVPTDWHEDPTFQIQGTNIYTVVPPIVTISSAGLNAEEFVYVNSDQYGGWDLGADGYYKCRLNCAALATFPRAGVRIQYQNYGVDLFVHDDPLFPAHKVYFGHNSAPGQSFSMLFDTTNVHEYSVIAHWYEGTADLFIDSVWKAKVPLYNFGVSRNRLSYGHIIAHAAGGGATYLSRLRWDALERDQAIYRSKIPVTQEWNHFSFRASQPDAVNGSPTGFRVSRIYYYTFTKNAADLLADPYVDTFGSESIHKFAKTDYVMNDGSSRWMGKILEMGSVTKNLNERVGNYSISDLTVKFENASGFMGKIFQDEDLNMNNSSFAIKYGLADEVYEDFITLFKGALMSAKFDNYEFEIGLTDPVPQFFNRLPNQYVTKASFPLLADDKEGFVAPIIIGEVINDFGALSPIPVDWMLELPAGSMFRTGRFSFKRAGDTDPIQYFFSLGGFETFYDDSLIPLLCTRIATAMNLAAGSPPSNAYFSVTFDAVKRKFKVNLFEPTADSLTLHSATDFQSGYGGLWAALGFSRVEDKSGSRDVESDYSAWNIFVVARHPTYKPTPEPSLYYEDQTQPVGVITWYHNTKSIDGLSWTTVWTNNVCSGERELRCNATGFSDTMASDGNLVTNPVTALYFVLKYFVNFPDTLLDAAGFAEAEATAALWRLRCDGSLTEDSEWNAFIEDYCKNFKIDIWMTNRGLIRPGIFLPVVTDIDSLNVTDIADILEGSFQYDAGFDGIINRIRYEFDKNHIDGSFKNSGTIQDNTSIDSCKRMYDWPDGTLRFTWVRDWYTANRIANLYLAMFYAGNRVATIKLPMIKEYIPELTQKINVSTAAGPSYRYDSSLACNVRGFENRLHRITGVEVNLSDYSIELKLQDIYNITARCFFLGDRLWPAPEQTWLTATTEHRVKYGYLCDRITGVFTDGYEGKRLC